MPISPPAFEWQTAPCEEEWLALDFTPSATPQVHRRVTPRMWSLLGLLLVVISISVFALWRTAEAGWTQIETELRSAVEVDEMLSHQGRALPAMAMETVAVHGAAALVQVVVTQTLPSGKPEAYQELRFFQQTDQGWMRSAADPALLGARRTLETEHFQIHYREIDAGAAHSLATRLDSLYEQIRVNFGVSQIARKDKISVEVATDKTAVGQSLVRQASNYTIQIPSPVLFQVPVDPASEDIVDQPVYRISN